MSVLESNRPGTPVGVDVLDLDRVARVDAAFGEALERRLLSPLEAQSLADGSRPDRVSLLAASWAAKEAWIKTVGGRPHGWSYASAGLEPVRRDSLPAAAEEIVACFQRDVGATAVGVGVLRVDGAARGWWACHARTGRWLVAAVLS